MVLLVFTGLVRRSDDALAPYAAAVLRATHPANRLHDSSAITRTVEGLRAHGVDPLDASMQQLDAVLPPGSRRRTRSWRPFARFLGAAGEAGALTPRGQLLLARMTAGPTGRRNYLGAYRAEVQALGYDVGTAPVEVRERFLGSLTAADASPAVLDATREAIRRMERGAVRMGARRRILPRHEHLVRALLTAGVSSEAEALALIDAAHVGYAPSVHRWADAIIARWLDWCEAFSVQPLSPTPDQLAAFRRIRGDALGMGPIHRLLAAAADGGVASCAA